jgi:hypothetical protein
MRYIVLLAKLHGTEILASDAAGPVHRSNNSVKLFPAPLLLNLRKRWLLGGLRKLATMTILTSVKLGGK